jgi:hypothetical protein
MNKNKMNRCGGILNGLAMAVGLGLGTLGFGDKVKADLVVGDRVGNYSVTQRHALPSHGSSDLAVKDGVWYSLDNLKGNIRTIDPQSGALDDYMYVQGFLGNWGMSLHNEYPDDSPRGLAISGDDVYMGSVDLYLQPNDPNIVRVLNLEESDEQNQSIHHYAYLTHRSRDLAFGNGELYSIGDDGNVNVIDPDYGNVLRSFAAPRKTASLAYTPQGTLLGASWGVGDHVEFSEFSCVDGTLLWEEDVAVPSGVFSMGIDSQTGNVGFATGLNNFYLMEPVPEPESLGLLGVGVLAAGFAGRRKRS